MARSIVLYSDFHVALRLLAGKPYADMTCVRVLHHVRKRFLNYAIDGHVRVFTKIREVSRREEGATDRRTFLPGFAQGLYGADKSEAV